MAMVMVMGLMEACDDGGGVTVSRCCRVGDSDGFDFGDGMVMVMAFTYLRSQTHTHTHTLAWMLSGWRW